MPARTVPLRVRLIAGDAINALRASVDNLVWGLGQTCGAESSLALFFRSTPNAFQSHARKTRLYKLPVEIQQWMEDQQAYSRSDGEVSKLHRLNRLWNDDKHRLPVLITNAEPVTVFNSVRGHLSQVLVDTSADGKAIVIAEGAGLLDLSFAVEVRFPESRYKTAVEVLREMHTHIEADVLPRFAPHL